MEPKIITQVRTRDIPLNWDVFVTPAKWRRRRPSARAMISSRDHPCAPLPNRRAWGLFRTAGGSRRDRADPAGVVVVDRLADFSLAVHYERPLTDNRLVDRLAGQHQQ